MPQTIERTFARTRPPRLRDAVVRHPGSQFGYDRQAQPVDRPAPGRRLGNRYEDSTRIMDRAGHAKRTSRSKAASVRARAAAATRRVAAARTARPATASPSISAARMPTRDVSLPRRRPPNDAPRLRRTRALCAVNDRLVRPQRSSIRTEPRVGPRAGRRQRRPCARRGQRRPRLAWRPRGPDARR
jgi:hypothetical protein